MVLIRKKTETGWWQGELSGGVSNLYLNFCYILKLLSQFSYKFVVRELRTRV
jgi:hypothetical protein